MQYAKKNNDGQWIIREEHKHRFAPFKEVNMTFRSFMKAYIAIAIKDIPSTSYQASFGR
jgi:hypothetical protein